MKIMDLVEEDSIILSDPTHIYYMTGLQAALKSSEQVLLRSGPIFLKDSWVAMALLLSGRQPRRVGLRYEGRARSSAERGNTVDCLRA